MKKRQRRTRRTDERSQPSDVASTPRDRAVGALVGLAVGDAIGTTLEFQRPGTFAPINDMVGGGPFDLPVGAWTDDTSMAMCLAESILDTDTLDASDQLHRYFAWWRDGYWSSTGRCFDIGTTTSRALARFANSGAVTDAEPDEESAPNGSLMRVAPVPIRWHADVAEAADRSGESSRTTHPSAQAIDTCRVTGATIAALIQGKPDHEVFGADFWNFGALHPAVESVARGSWASKQPPDIKGAPYCVQSLEAAMWAVGGAVDFRHAVLRAANLGDDADTTAAIAGQIAGARWGWSGIPSAWREQIVAAERIGAIAGRLHDLGSGAEALDPWAHDEVVSGWWIQRGTVLAGEYPGHRSGNPEPHSADDKLHLLVDHGIRTFIDMTTPLDPVEPYQDRVDEVAALRGLDVRRVAHPLPATAAAELDTYRAIVGTITDARRRGGVFVHCWDGTERTSTVAGCLLVAEGLDADSALATVHQQRSLGRKGHQLPTQDTALVDIVRQYDTQH